MAGADGADWGSYLDGVATFAGTVFALVLAARQIRGPLGENPEPKVSWARLVDSVAVTAELAAAASLALLYEIRESALFMAAGTVIALAGLCLSVASLVLYLESGLAFKPGEWFNDITQGFGNLLPFLCYVVALLYALRVIGFGAGDTWGYVSAVSWLTFSGVVQSILWYSSMWAIVQPKRESQG